MLIIGSHVHFDKEQLLGSAKEAISYGANAFMFYTGAPQNTLRSAINDAYTYEAYQLMKDHDIDLNHVICHAPYIINLANNNDPDKYQFSMNFLRNEINRCEELGVKYLVLHPGSAVGIERRTALNNIINALNNTLIKEDKIMILLETMAGKGTELGINLDEMSYLIKGITLNDKVGVCLDTCHLNDSGVNINNFDTYLNLFDKHIGIAKIKCIHVNDSKNNLGDHKDRHENIGYGTIGFDALLNVIYNDKLKDVPRILETPYIGDNAPYKEEIAMIRAKTFNPHLKDNN